MNKGIAAVIIFLAVLALPLVYNVGASVTGVSTGAPALAEGKGPKCVKDGSWMKRNHMTLLKHVREDSVRQGVLAGDSGLRGCIACHPKRGEFCDKCHSYVGANPECWRCHYYPV